MLYLLLCFAKRHWLILASAAALTILVSLPVLLFPVMAGEEYRGISIAHFGTDEHYYLTRGKEILEGHGLGNIILREGKDAKEPQFTYVEYALLLPLRALGVAPHVDVVTLYNVFTALGVFILILLIYFFALELKDDRLFAVLSALFVVGGYSIIYNKTIGSPELNIYGRAIFPYISSIVFFIFARLTLKSLRSPNGKDAFFAGLSFGALFYVFFYAWSFALALLGSLIVVYLIKKEFFQVKKLTVIALVGLALGAFNLIHLLLFYAGEQGRQLAFFLWAAASRTPILSKISLAMIVVLAVYAYRRRGDSRLPVIIGFILAGLVALNQQIITGRVVQYGHYYWFFVVPFSIVLGWYMVWGMLPSERSRRLCFAAVLLIVFINSVVGQYRMTVLLQETKIDEQRYQPIIEKLANDQRPGVVLAPDGARGLLVTIYTPHDLLWNTTALVYNTSVERIEEMLIWYLYLTPESRFEPRRYLEQAFSDSSRDSDAKELYRALEGLTSGLDFSVYTAQELRREAPLLAYRQDVLRRVEGQYRAAVAHPRYVDSFLQKYGVTYVVWDKNKNPEWDLSIFPDAEEVASSDGVSLYQLRR